MTDNEKKLAVEAWLSELYDELYCDARNQLKQALIEKDTDYLGDAAYRLYNYIIEFFEYWGGYPEFINNLLI